MTSDITSKEIPRAMKEEAILKTYEIMLKRHPDQKSLLDDMLDKKLKALK